MEFSNFFKLIKRHKYTIVLMPIVCMLITYFLVRNQTSKYYSQAKLATGLADQNQKIFNDEADVQESKINQEFSNVLEMLHSKRVINQVSYSLIIHDLTSKDPYLTPSKLFSQLNSNARQHALQVFSEKFKKREDLSLNIPDQKGLNEVLISMHYDDQSLLSNLSIYRIQNSDYIQIQFESGNPNMSADVVNTLSNEFINYYTLLVRDNQKKAVGFLGNLLKAKEDSLNKRMEALKAYKIENHVLNLNEKAKSIYAQMADFETRKEEVEKNIQSTRAAINSIDQQFDPGKRQYIESSKVLISQQISLNRAQLEKVNDEYVQSNFDPKYKSQIDSLTRIISSQSEKLSDKYILNPLTSKQNLVDQKLALQIQYELAKNSVKTIDNELDRLHKQFDSLVPHEGTIQALEGAVTVASQEYLEILQKYNQTNTVSKYNIKLRVIEPAEPGLAQSSKKMLIVLISGVVSFLLCIAVLFLIFFFDNTINSPADLANRTNVPVLGNLSQLNGKSIDLHSVWNGTTPAGEIKQFKNLVQSLRFEADSELLNHKVLLINSITKAEGKTFTAINLAYAWSAVNKKVLLIDGNFSNPGITEFAKPKYYLEDFLNGNNEASFLADKSEIKILGNKGNDISIFELGNEHQIAEKFAILKTKFDIIIIEASALDTLNKSKEWVSFSDKILSVFEAGENIGETSKQPIEYLKGLNGKFMGWVLNLEQVA